METSSKFSASTLFPFFNCSATDLHETHPNTQKSSKLKKLLQAAVLYAFIDFIEHFLSNRKKTKGDVYHKYNDDDNDDADDDHSDDNDDDIETADGRKNHTVF